jgi:hypothetical protein
MRFNVPIAGATLRQGAMSSASRHWLFNRNSKDGASGIWLPLCFVSATDFLSF